MKVYYQDDFVTLYHGDALEIMKSLPQADAVRHLSDYRQDGEVVTESAAKTLLDKMVDEDLLIKTRIASKTRYSIPKPNFITVGWGVTDNGVRLGMHLPPSPAVIRGGVDYA